MNQANPAPAALVAEKDAPATDDAAELDELDEQASQYLLVREGKYSDFLTNHVHRIIVQRPGLIVFLDSNLRARVVGEDGDWSSAYTSVINQVVRLEAAPFKYLPREQREALRIFGGHALARCIDDDDAIAANTMLEDAWTYYRERSAEVSRRWYLTSSIVGLIAITAAITMGTVWPHHIDAYDDNARLIFFSGCMGGIGAFVLIFSRLGSSCPDPSGGMLLHILEALTRLLVGCLSGIVFTIAILGGVAFGFAFPQATDTRLGDPFYIALLVSVAAGLSERAMPDLVTKMNIADTTKELEPSGKR